MTTRFLKIVLLLVAAGVTGWAATALLGAAYELRKFGSPFGYFDLQLAGTPDAAGRVLESWAVMAGTDAFGRARTHARWDLVLTVSFAVILIAALLLVRGPLRTVRHTPSGWHVSDRFAAVLEELLLSAVAAASVGAILGVAADLVLAAVLGTAEARGPAAAVGRWTVVASVLALGKLILSAFAVFVLTCTVLYVVARNRSPKLQEFLEVVRVTRFSLIAVVAVGAGLCVPDQLRDAFRALAEGSWLRVLLTEVVLLAWAFTVWYTGRFLLNVSFETQPAFGGPADPPHELWGERYWPRILGSLAFVVFALATWLAWYDVADSPDVGYPPLLFLAIVNVVLGVAFWAFTRLRRVAMEKLTGHYASPRGLAYRNMPPSVQWLVKGAVTVVVLLWLLVFWIPQPIAPYLGTVGLLLGASITVTMVGSMVVWGGERAKVPAVSIVFVMAILFSFINDNHTVRKLPEAARPPRIDALAHVKDWYHWIDRKYGDEKEHPLFIISAAGGGIRAAYWTATALARLQDLNPAFADHTLLVSGVSGGSLGALVFANLIESTAPGGDWRGGHASFGGRANPGCPYPQEAPGKYQALAARILARDFLAPTTASMLYGDFLARLLPYSLLSDRAEALEVSWERAWDTAKHQPPGDLDRNTLWAGNPFSRSFDALHAATQITSDRPTTARHVPLMVLNGTIVETGARIIVSHLRHPETFRGDLENAFDYRDAPIRMSTAALMSARFTYVSPAGTYAPGTHVVDGGYFENSGAATALQWWAEVEDWVFDVNQKTRRQRGRDAIKPFFIYIDNAAPDAARVQPLVSKGPQPRRMEVRERTPMLPELSAPINALLAAREAHAVEAKTRARHEFIEFVSLDTGVLRKAGAAAPPHQERLNAAPLGWVLSRSAQQILDRALCRNDDNVSEILAVLPKGAGR